MAEGRQVTNMLNVTATNGSIIRQEEVSIGCTTNHYTTSFHGDVENVGNVGGSTSRNVNQRTSQGNHPTRCQSKGSACDKSSTSSQQNNPFPAFIPTPLPTVPPDITSFEGPLGNVGILSGSSCNDINQTIKYRFADDAKVDAQDDSDANHDSSSDSDAEGANGKSSGQQKFSSGRKLRSNCKPS